jgi:cyclin B
VTNRAKAKGSTKDAKPIVNKRTATGHHRAVARKRDAALADLKPQDVTTVDEVHVTKRDKDQSLALKSLKEGAKEVSKAIDAEAKVHPSVLADATNLPVTESINPFKEVTQSPVNHETLDLEPALAPNVAEQPEKEPSYQFSGAFHDIDKRDADDELCVTDYVGDMYEYFRSEEHRARVDPQYILFQKEINPRMRAILIDWLTLVTNKSKLSPDVLYLTVNILDRYLSLKKATKKNLQLIGTAALFIASKYEDIYHVPVSDLVYLCDRAYTEEQIYTTEHKILKALNYQISLPNSYKFLLRFLNAGHADKKMVYLTCYLMELTMLKINFTDYLPSELAAAAVLIARKAIGRNAWSPTLLKYSEYTEEEIIPVARDMLEAVSELKVSKDLTASKTKYSSERKLKVALIRLPTEL